MATGQNSTESSFGFDVDEVLEANQQPPQPAPPAPQPKPANTEVALDVAALLASSEKAVDVEIERPDGTFEKKKAKVLIVPDGFFKGRTVDGDFDVTDYIVCAESQSMPAEEGGATPVRIAMPTGDCAYEISFEVSTRRPDLRPDAPTRASPARRPISSFSDPMRCSHLAFSLYAYAVV